MSNNQLANEMISLLCDYFSDKVIFEILLERWGVDTLYSVLADMMSGANDGE